MVEVSTRWNGERQRRPTGTDLGMEPRARGSSAPGMADRRLHSKERNGITVNHDVTGGVTNAVTEAVTATRIAMLQGCYGGWHRSFYTCYTCCTGFGRTKGCRQD